MKQMRDMFQMKEGSPKLKVMTNSYFFYLKRGAYAIV